MAIAGALTLPLFAIGIVLTALLFVSSLRRLLGLRLSLLRTLIAGVIAYLVASPIITALLSGARAAFLPDLWFVILGYAIALVVGMTILVVAEAFVPSDSLPGPVYLARGLRARLARMKRYWQVTRILMRHGLVPYLRGGRRAELRTAASVSVSRPRSRLCRASGCWSWSASTASRFRRSRPRLDPTIAMHWPVTSSTACCDRS